MTGQPSRGLNRGMDWLSAVEQLRTEGRPGVLITITDVRGHAPRDAGTKMVVGTDRIWGSVGGGNLEETAIDRARGLITAMTGGARPQPVRWESRLNSRERTEHGRQCCGGVVGLLLEPLPVRPTVAIFGVGHVGFELARILCRLELTLQLVDSRAEQLDPLRLAGITDGAADVIVHRTPIGEPVLERLPAGSQVLIMTHDHAEDYALCDAVLRRVATRDDLGLIGLIGSSAKWARFRANLLADGHTADVITRISSPIGLPGLSGKEPVVIAVGVAADLITRMQPSTRPDRRRPEPVEGQEPDRRRPEPVEAQEPDRRRPEPVEAQEPDRRRPEPVKAQEPDPRRPEPVKAQEPDPRCPEPVEGQVARR